MENTIYVKPEELHSTMVRLRKEKQMDFLRSLTGMDWGRFTTWNPPLPRKEWW